jgi:hypothetical protein
LKRIHSGTDHGQLLRRDRRVVAAGELTEEEIELIAKAEVPAEHADPETAAEFFRRRAAGASPADLKPFLHAAPDVPPMPGDELP